MRGELKELHRRVGGTMVYVTHDQVEALTLGDRLAVLDGGAVQQIGTPDELFARPANRFVARFIGSPAMNLVPARLDDDALVAGPLRLPRPPRLPAGRALEVGFRPERVRLRRDHEGSARARVTLVEPVGSEAYVHVRADGEDVVARVVAEDRPEPGADVSLEVREEHLHVFDGETGERLEWTR